MLIQLNQLKPNPSNVRTVKADNLDKLIASIKSRDLLHNLVVQKNGVGYNVIDGNRRYEALCKIHGKSSAIEIDCKLIEDDATEIGAMANMLREGMHPLDEAEAIHNVLTDGEMDYNQLASNWGQTNKWVMQRVKLSELSTTVKEAFRNKEFNLSIAQLFTVLDHEAQDELYKNCNGRFNYDDIEDLVQEVKLISSKVIIPKAHRLYKTIEFTGDLFSEFQYVADMKKFLAIQLEYVEEKANSLRKKHKDCTVIDCHPSEVKGLLKNLVQCYSNEEKDLDPKDINVVITYRPIRGDLWIMKYRSKIEMSQKELDAIESGVIPELGLVDMSTPQRDMTNVMYYDYLRSEFSKTQSKTYSWVLAMLCNQMIPNNFFSDGENTTKHYTSISYHLQGETNGYFDNVNKEVADYCKKHKCNSLAFFTSKDDNYLTSLLYQGVVASMDQSETFSSQKDIYNIPVAKDWFKPTENWLNKYKIVQLRLLANKVKCKLLPHDNKKLVIDKLLTAFKDGAVFDPIKFLNEVK